MSEIRERIMSRVRKCKSGCWEWTGASSNEGYGRVKVAGKLESPHRLMWEEENGPIPDGLWILHDCDNPPCVNPAHLFLGTRSDNMLDASKKGRTRGERPERRTREKNGKVQCCRCKDWFAPDDFYKYCSKDPRGWCYNSYCKICNTEYARERRKYRKHA